MAQVIIFEKVKAFVKSDPCELSIRQIPGGGWLLQELTHALRWLFLAVRVT